MVDQHELNRHNSLRWNANLITQLDLQELMEQLESVSKQIARTIEFMKRRNASSIAVEGQQDFRSVVETFQRLSVALQIENAKYKP